MKRKLGLGIMLVLLGYGTGQAQVLPPDAIVEGKTMGEWSAEWWLWVFSAHLAKCPQVDTDGQWAHEGQPGGDVFLVAGSPGFTPDTIVREFAVPEGKYLFLPMLTAQIDNIETEPPFPVEEMRDLLRAFVNDPIELHASIDGVPVPNLLSHRAESPVFSVEYLFPDNFKSRVQGLDVVGFVEPNLADGYWLMIEPLAPGPHTLHFGGTWRLPFFNPNDVTVHLTVVPISLAERVGDLKRQLLSGNLPLDREHALAVSLNAALSSFDRNNFNVAVNQLRAFQHKVRAQVAREDAALAVQLVQAAQDIIDSIFQP